MTVKLNKIYLGYKCPVSAYHLHNGLPECDILLLQSDGSTRLLKGKHATRFMEDKAGFHQVAFDQTHFGNLCHELFMEYWPKGVANRV